MLTARTTLSTSVMNGKIYAIGGDLKRDARGWPWTPTSVVEVYDTGFVPTSVNPAGKFPTLWGKLKAAR